MPKILLSLIICLMLSFSCTKEKKVADKKTFEYFQTNLTSTMDYAAIQISFGSPDSDIGSGIHIYRYKLTDGTEIRIGFVNKILYAIHVDSNGLLLHTII